MRFRTASYEGRPATMPARRSVTNRELLCPLTTIANAHAYTHFHWLWASAIAPASTLDSNSPCSHADGGCPWPRACTSASDSAWSSGPPTVYTVSPITDPFDGIHRPYTVYDRHWHAARHGPENLDSSSAAPLCRFVWELGLLQSIYALR